MFCEIRDEYNHVECAGLVSTTAEANLWFQEHGLTLADVTSKDDGYNMVFSYSRSTI